MILSAAELLSNLQHELAPLEASNRFVPEVAAGRAPVTAIGLLAAEETHLIPSDRRSFLWLAARAAGTPASDLFTTLVAGETAAEALLPALAAAVGWDSGVLRAYEPRAEAQAYGAYVAWLALNGDPAAVGLAMIANFAAWGGYCREVAAGLRKHYAFDDTACGFLDFFAAPTTELEEQAVAVAQATLDAGGELMHVRRYARLLQSYELMFWNTLTDAD